MEVLSRQMPVLAEDWMILVILLILSMLAYVNVVYPSRFNKLLRATFNERLTRQVMREEMVFSHRASVILLLICCGIFSLFLSVIGESMIGRPPQETFIPIILFLGVGFLARQGLRSLFSKLFVTESGLREFSFVSALVYKVAGLFAIPLVIAMVLTQQKVALIISATLVILLVLAMGYRLFRGVRIGMQNHRAVFSTILYLCTLEILPTLVILRIISDL